jgi:transcriptional regulator of acetoin/glycerol metabolism
VDRDLRESARGDTDPLRQGILLRRAGQINEALDSIEEAWAKGANAQAAELLLETIATQPPEQQLQHAGRLDRLAHAGLPAAGALLVSLFPEVGAVVGISQAAQELRAFLFEAAAHERPVLLWGENGAGHEVAARMVHALSARTGFYQAFGPRRHSLLQREIDQHPEDGGTLYVSYAEPDQGWEDLVLSTCARRNLRLIVGEIGGGPEPRLLRGTGMEAQRIAPLRERFEDLPLLVRDVLTTVGAADAAESLKLEDIRRLEWYDWPGNLRELGNHVSRAVLQSGNRDVSGSLFQGLFGLPGEVAEHLA